MICFMTSIKWSVAFAVSLSAGEYFEFMEVNELEG